MKRQLTLSLSVILLLIVYGITIAALYYTKYNGPSLDFSIIYKSIQLLFQGKIPYLPEKHYFGILQTYTIDLNPPFFILLFSFLGLVSHTIAFFIWEIAALLFGLGLCLITSSTFFNRSGVATMALFCGLLLYLPTFFNITFGQTGLLVAFLCALLFSLSTNKKENWSGFLLALLLSFKLFTGMYLILFLFQKRWRLLGSFILFFALFTLVSWGLMPAGTFSQYISNHTLINWYSNTWNTSFVGFMSPLFGLPKQLGHAYSFNPLVTKISFWGAFILGTFLLYWSVRKQSSHAQINKYLPFSFATVLMLLISPLAWIYYFPVLMIAFVTLGLSTLSRPILFCATMVALMLSSLPLPLQVIQSGHPLWEILTLYSYSFYSILILAVLHVCVLMLPPAVNKGNRMSNRTASILMGVALVPSLIALALTFSRILIYCVHQ
jgi:hypothetical protein